MFYWISRRTLLSLALLQLALGIVVWQLVSIVRGLDSELLLTVTALGLLVGWGLARSSLKGWPSCLVAFTLGIVAVLVRVGRLDGKMVTLLLTLADFASHVSRWPTSGSMDVRPILQVSSELVAAIGTLGARLRDWWWALAANQSAYDPVATAIVWSLLMWGLAIWAAWAMRRRAQPLHGLLPAIALLAVVLFYVGAYPFALLPLLGTTLLLTAFIAHDTREQHWQTVGIDYSDDLRFDLALTVVPLTIMLLMLAVLMPSLSVQDAVKVAQKLFAGQAVAATPLSNALGLEQHAVQTTSPFDALRSPGLPRRHLIGSGPELSRQPVMSIKTNDLVSDGLPPRYYWRGVSYERYTGRGWIAEPSETVKYKAGEPAISSPLPLHRKVRQEVQMADEVGGLLYTAGTLIVAEQDYLVAWRSPGDAFGANVDAPVYRAESFVPVLYEAQVRSTTSDYPEWVRKRYLALPDDVPARVLALARDLTATEPTAYDRARAIEKYLRTFPYTLDLPAPPMNRDVVDYFLFDLKTGYCDYYASAMVVLARAAGLPARLVVGYVSGKYDAANARYLVTAADAHSWAEIYFAGYGWVEFEPTGGRPPIERLDETMPMVEMKSDSHLVNGNWRVVDNLVWLALLGGSVVFALGSAAWFVSERWRLRRMSPLMVVSTIYARLYRHGRRLTVPLRRGDTPYELGMSLSLRVDELAQDCPWGTAFSSVTQDIRWLIDIYVRASFSLHRPGAAERIQTLAVWQRLDRRLWLAWLWQRRRRQSQKPTVRMANGGDSPQGIVLPKIDPKKF